MKGLLIGACAAFGLATAAHGSVIPVLDSVNPFGSEFEFTYSGTLAGDQGLIDGSRLIIFDFEGYVPGSISVGIYGPDLEAFTENTSTLAPPFAIVDNPLIPNLVFRWRGSPFNASGGPFFDIDFAGLSARSIYGATQLGTFTALTVTNNGRATGLPATNGGFVGAPMAAVVVPEPATWAMLVLGFGGAGTMLRARRRRTVSA